MPAEIPLIWFNVFSLAVAFLATAFAFRTPKSFLFIIAFATAVFLLLGIFSIPGMVMGFAFVVFLKNRSPLAASTKKRKV